MYVDRRVQERIEREFLPVKIHVKEQPQIFGRWRAQWTPTIVILDDQGVERHRFEGFLPAPAFLAQLTLGLGRVAFGQKRWAEAERWFESVMAEFPGNEAAPEALYWAGVSRHEAGDRDALRRVGVELRTRYASSSWAQRASVWEPQEPVPVHRPERRSG